MVRSSAEVRVARDERSLEEYREALNIVADQSSRLTHLVDAMFMLSRAEAHGVPLTREPIYLNDLVAECVRGMRVLALGRRVTIDLRGDPEIAMSADDGLLRRVFGNLLDNAIRHASATIAVTLERDAETATVRVWNDGPAISSGDQRRIFERFIRLELGHGGAGLGLPIARTIAEAHGGSLVLEDSSQSGTCFCVTLPLFQAGEVTV